MGIVEECEEEGEERWFGAGALYGTFGDPSAAGWDWLKKWNKQAAL